MYVHIDAQGVLDAPAAEVPLVFIIIISSSSIIISSR